MCLNTKEKTAGCAVYKKFIWKKDNNKKVSKTKPKYYYHPMKRIQNPIQKKKHFGKLWENASHDKRALL